MEPVDSQILDFALEGLTAAGEPDGVSVHDCPGRPINTDTLPAMAVYPIDLTEMDADHDGAIEEEFSWAIECRAKATAKRSARQNLQDVITVARRWVRANRKMGGLAMDTLLKQSEGRKTIKWAPPQEVGESLAAARILCRSIYHTDAMDPEESES